MRTIKCPNCGANIYIEDYNNSSHCEYCGTPFAKDPHEKLSQNHTSDSNKPTTAKCCDGRPHINVGLAIFLFLLNVTFGMIYMLCVILKQVKWESAHYEPNQNNNQQSKKYDNDYDD
jgi:hypothetical protein